MRNLKTLRIVCSIVLLIAGIAIFLLPTLGPVQAQTKTTAWQNGKFNVDVANVVAQSNIVLGAANTGVLDSMPLGNGNLGVAVWAANGFTAQLNRTDTFPTRKSPGWVVIPGLSSLTGGSGYAGILDIYDGMFRQSGGGMTATTYVLQNKDELIIDVTGANPSSNQTAQIQLWSGRSPTASASGAFASLAESWVDNGAGGSGRTFGTLAGITAGGRNVTTSVVNSTTVQVSFNPNADGTFRIVVASPTWAGGNGLSTVTSLIGSDATASTSSLQSTHLTWWHNFWANTGLIKITGTNGPYVENIRDIELYAMAISSSGQYPGNHAGTLDLVSSNKDGVTWASADYWHWNLRMHVGANLMAGHPELNTSYFNLYASNVANIQAWTQQHMHGDGVGICVPETMRFNGNGYQNNDIGNPSCMDSVGPLWNAMDLTTGAEVSLWIWQQYLYTGSVSFLQTNYPVMADSARFLLSYAKVGSDGKLHTNPSNAHETQWNVQDPTTDIAAMHALFPIVISAAQILNTDSALVSQLQAAIPQLLDYPRTDTATKSQLLTSSSDASGNDMIAMSYQPTAQIRNSENIGLEPLYPYNLMGLGSPANILALANRTYTSRNFMGGNDWTFDAVDAARLGRASDFQSNVTSEIQAHQTFSAGFAQFSSSDFTPYVEMDGGISNAVQEALVQNYDGILRIAPAWPMSSWNVDGTVYIQGNSQVHVQVQNGQLVTVVLEAGKSGNIVTINPWGTQNVMVVDSGSGSTVVAATTASQFTIPITTGHAYIIELVSTPITSLPFAQITANPATTSKSLGSVKLGLPGSGVPPTITPSGPTPTPQPEAPFGGTAWTVPGQIEAENYDIGGEGVAYHDTTSGNSGGQYRTDNVDVETTTDAGGGYDVGYTVTGEWLKYTVNVTSAGTYNLNFRVASMNTGSTFHLEVDGTNVTGTMTVPNTGGWQTYQTVTKTSVGLSAGQHVLRLYEDNGGMNFNWLNISSGGATFQPPTNTPNVPTATPSGEAPYGGTAWAIPGQIEAENYDTGGEGVAYHDTTSGNSGNQYRTDNVDIDGTTDTGGGYEIGFTVTGEWLKYTVNVGSAGTYNLNFRAASPNTGSSFHLEIDGTNVTGTMTVPNTGGWQTYQTLTKSGVSLSAGQHVLRWYEDNGGMNFNWLSITAGNPTATPSGEAPYGGTAWAMPGQIEAENYDTGGEGVAYHDTTSGNSGNQYRTDNVDIDGTTDTGGGYEIGYTVTGEWLKYTVNVASAGTYNLNFRVASPNTGTSFHLEIDGTNVTGTMTVPNTGGWQAYQTLTKTGVSLSAGQHVLRWYEDNGGMNFNWLSITAG